MTSANLMLDACNDPSTFAVVMPTKDRPQFLGRALDFFQAQGFSGRVLVVDASSPELAEQNRAIVGRDRGMECLHFAPNTPGNAWTEIAEGLRTIDSTYTALCHDDDFNFLAEIERCIDFLQKHSDYVCASGRFAFVAHSAGTFDYSSQPMYACAGETTEERLGQILSRYCHLFFAVARREVTINAYTAVPAYLEQGWFDQIAMSALLASAGKTHTMDGLHCFRLVHPEQHHQGLIRDEPYKHWPLIIASPDFSTTYHSYRQCLLDQCGPSATVSLQALGRLIDEGLVALVRRSAGARAKSEPGDVHVMKALQVLGSPEQERLLEMVQVLQRGLS